jgi:AsmA protein
MDRTPAIPVLHLDFSLARFRIEDFFRRLPPGKKVSGAMDFSTTLELRGLNRAELRRSATGTMSLSGTDLVLDGADLDSQFSHFEASQEFNLFDMTAFFLAGPVGVAVTKGYQFAGIAQAKGGRTPIRRVVSRWKVENGIARAVDVALATGTHRLALHGGLDFVDEEFDEVYVSLIDADGCSRARQRIRGPFAKPVVEKPDLLVSAAGPVLTLIAKARSLLPGVVAACEVVYAGAVAPPAGERPPP